MDLTTIRLTVQIALVATAINLPIALAVSWLVVKKRIRGRFIIDVVVALPLALPPVAIGFFLLQVLGRDGIVGSPVHRLLGADIVFTWVAAAFASAIVSFPLMVRSVMVAIGGVDERLETTLTYLIPGGIPFLQLSIKPKLLLNILSNFWKSFDLRTGMRRNYRQNLI